MEVISRRQAPRGGRRTAGREPGVAARRGVRFVGPVLVTLAALLAGTPGGASAATPIRMFYTQDRPPYTYREQGEPAGPMVAVLQAVCAELKWRCEVRFLPWRQALARAEQGEADGLFTVADIAERRRFFHVTRPVLMARYALFARSGQVFVYKGPRSLAGHTVAAYGPSGTAQLLQELTQGLEVDVRVEPDNLTVLRRLGQGAYGPDGLALVNESTALTLLQNESLAPLQSAGVVRQLSYHFGLSRQRLKPADHQAFDRVLAQLCRSGATADLLLPYGLPVAPCR